MIFCIYQYNYYNKIYALEFTLAGFRCLIKVKFLSLVYDPTFLNAPPSWSFLLEFFIIRFIKELIGSHLLSVCYTTEQI